MIEVWNKVDLLDPGGAGGLCGGGRAQTAVNLISAADRHGLDRLLEAVTGDSPRAAPWSTSTSTTAPAKIMAWLHRHGEVLETTDDGERPALQGGTRRTRTRPARPGCSAAPRCMTPSVGPVLSKA